MKRLLSILAIAVVGFGLNIQDAEAKRLGGGKSVGMQRESVTTQRQASPAPSAPQQQAAPAYNPSPAGMPSAQPQRRSWLGPLAGLAAGVGLAALFSHFGLGEGLADFAMIALLAIAGLFLVKMLFGRKQAQAPQSEPLQYAGAGNAHGQPPLQPSFPAGGNALSGQGPSIPAGFDVEGFTRVAKVNFVRLQAANDSGNLDDLRQFTTPEMFAELKMDIDDRRGAGQQTDIVTLEAEVLEVVTENRQHIASVRFHGMLREEKDGAATPFDEVWNLTKPVDGNRGWAVAGIQQLS
ncbi:MAG: hypothetical protein RIR00_2276 [Pseudomonadota bacterium]